MGAGSIGLKAIFTADDRVTSKIVGMQSAVIGFTDTAGKSLGKLDAFNSKLAGGLKTAGLALGGVGLGAAVVAKNVVDAGADFEQAITNVGAVSLMTREQVAPLEKLALQLGATTKFSATEVAGAMEMMGKAGFDNGQILEGVGGILSAAAADGAELADTASNISNVLKGMGLEVSQSTRVADVLTLASARTNSSIASLGESMANVSSTARQLGVPLEDTVAMVAMLQDVGLDASEAGSATATMLTKLAAPSKAAAAQMAAMGVAFQDSAGNMLAPTKVLEQLVKAGQKAGGNMSQVAFFAELVGMRGQKAALNLKDLFKSGKVTGLVEELQNAAGSAEKMSGIRMDTFKGDIETLGGSIDSLKIKLFDMQNGPLRGVAKGTTEWIDANSDLIAGGLNDFIREAIPLLDNFKDGVLSAGEEALPLLRGVGNVLGKVFGTDSKSQRQEAFLWGETIATWGIRWVEFTVLVKGAQLAMWGFGNATKIARGATIAYEATITFFKGTMALYNTVTAVGSANTIAFAGALQGTSVAAGGAASAATAATGAFSSLAAQAGLAAVAIGAVWLANDQLNKFLAENGGWDGFDAFMGLGTEGGEWGFEAVDAMQNRKAKERAAAEGRTGGPSAPLTPKQEAAAKLLGIPSEGGKGSYAEQFGLPAPAPRSPGPYADAFVAPGGMAPPASPVPPALARPVPTPEEFHAMVQQELTIKLTAEPGTSAEVTKKPKGSKVSLPPSGAP